MGTYDLSVTKMTCMDALIQRKYGCLRAVMTVHPEHKKAARYIYLAAFLQHEIKPIQNLLKQPYTQDI